MESEPTEKPLCEYSDSMLRWLLTINQCHLADVRDAQTALTKEWDELQEVRAGIVSEIQSRLPKDVA